LRFLIDRCAGKRIADRLRVLGHDVVEAREPSPDPGDDALLAWAAAERRVLVTMDKDFGELVYRQSAPHAGLIRLPHVPSAKRVALIEQVLADYSPGQIEGAVVTVRGTRVRISMPKR